MSRDMWRLFRDERFAVRFWYPETAPSGERVEKLDYVVRDATRVHYLTTDHSEVYFEISRYPDSPQDGYRRLKVEVESRFDGLQADELVSTCVGGRDAYEFRFRWPGRERVAIFVPVGGGTYRIIYDPRSAVNTDVLATVTFTGDR